MKVESINQTLPTDLGEPTGVGLMGGYIEIEYGNTRVYLNQQGREVIRVSETPWSPVGLAQVTDITPPSWWQRFKRWLAGG